MTLALKPVQFINIECAVMQLGQHIMLAEIFEIGFGLFARRNIGKRNLNQRPIVFVAW